MSEKKGWWTPSWGSWVKGQVVEKSTKRYRMPRETSKLEEAITALPDDARVYVNPTLTNRPAPRIEGQMGMGLIFEIQPFQTLNIADLKAYIGKVANLRKAGQEYWQASTLDDSDDYPIDNQFLDALNAFDEESG